MRKILHVKFRNSYLELGWLHKISSKGMQNLNNFITKNKMRMRVTKLVMFKQRYIIDRANAIFLSLSNTP